ncbi:MAG TPA: MMPL family transporter, partial [Blastocatellia bacterium]|nr:MMPL family transporter [Blastocatellia bacterium]
MNRAARLVVFYPKTIIAAVLAITALFTAALVARGVGFNGSPETLARKDSSLEFFNEVRSTFGDDRVIIVALTTADVFTTEFIERLDRLTGRLTRVPGVADARSLTNIQAVRRQNDSINVDRMIPRSGVTGEYLSALRQTVTRDPLYARQFVSEDGRTAAVSVFINSLTESQSRAVAEQVEAVARAEAGQDELMLAGVPVMDARAIESMVRDMLICSPIAALLCFVVFLAAFRSLWGAILPMAALVIGLVWTFGLMSLTGSEITFATLPLPTVLLAIGSSYIFHIQNQCRISTATAAADRDRKQAWLEGFIFITPSVFVSGTTTIAGFASLASSPVPTVRDMGIFEAAGVTAMLLLSLTFIPAALAILPAASLGQVSSHQKDYATWLNGLLKQITALILFRKRTVLLFFLVSTALVGAGALSMRVNTDYLSIFPESSDTVQSARRLHERLAGAASVQLVVTGARDAVLEPEFLDGVARLEEFSLEQPGVDSSISIAGIVKRFNRVLSGEQGGEETLPRDRERVKSIFDDYLSQDDFISRLVSRDQSRAIIVLRTNLFGSNELKALNERIEAWSRANLPQGASVRATGSFVLLN